MMPVLAAQGLSRHFGGERFLGIGKPSRLVRAVDGISFALPEGQTLSLVGESGCGKTTTARMLLRLIPPSAGEILFEGQSLAQAPTATLLRYRLAVQAVFQDPWSSLSPRLRAAAIIAEPLRLNTTLSRDEIESKVAEAMLQVGLSPSRAGSFPHEFSGGQRQRIAIARAIVMRPKVVVLDEPVSALDVSIRAQIMNLLRDLKESANIGFVLIAHNLATVRFLSDHVAVMYAGRIVEEGPSPDIFRSPAHPYTSTLIEASRLTRPGDVPPPTPEAEAIASKGCAFAPRCRRAEAACRAETPILRDLGGGRRAACHFA
jgi:oligopeptide/dipeptide ABC transporter ATP-binding protein